MTGLFGNEAVGCEQYRESIASKVVDKLKSIVLSPDDDKINEFGEAINVEKKGDATVVHHKINPDLGLSAGGYIDSKRIIHVLDKECFGRYVMAHEMAHWRRWNAPTFRFLRWYKYSLGAGGLFSLLILAVLMFVINIEWLGWIFVILYFTHHLVNVIEERKADKAAKESEKSFMELEKRIKRF